MNERTGLIKKSCLSVCFESGKKNSLILYVLISGKSTVIKRLNECISGIRKMYRNKFLAFTILCQGDIQLFQYKWKNKTSNCPFIHSHRAKGRVNPGRDITRLNICNEFSYFVVFLFCFCLWTFKHSLISVHAARSTECIWCIIVFGFCSL